MPLFTSGGLGLGRVIFGLILGLVSSGLGLGLRNLILFTSLAVIPRYHPSLYCLTARVIALRGVCV